MFQDDCRRVAIHQPAGLEASAKMSFAGQKQGKKTKENMQSNGLQIRFIPEKSDHKKCVLATLDDGIFFC